MAAPKPEALTEVIAPVVHTTGSDLEAIEIDRIGGQRVVRVIVDRDGGVDMDAIAEISGAVSRALDEVDIVDDSYVLEVTSPGVDRPLTLPRHWARNIGRLVRVVDADGEWVGRIASCSDSTAVITVGDLPHEVTLAGVTRATIEIEFNRPKEEAE